MCACGGSCGGNCGGNCGAKNSNIPIGTALTGDMIYDGPETTVNGITISPGDKLNNVLVNIMNSRSSFEMIRFNSGNVLFTGEGGGQEVVQSFTLPSAGKYLIMFTLNFSGVLENNDGIYLVNTLTEGVINDVNGFPVGVISSDNSKSVQAILDVTAANLTIDYGLYVDAGSNDHDYNWTLGVYKL